MKDENDLYATYLRKRAEQEEKGYQLTEPMDIEKYIDRYSLAKMAGKKNIAREFVEDEKLISYSMARKIRSEAEKLLTSEEGQELKSETKSKLEDYSNKKIRDIISEKIEYDTEEIIQYHLKNKYTKIEYEGEYKMTKRKALFTKLKRDGISTKEIFGY